MSNFYLLLIDSLVNTFSQIEAGNKLKFKIATQQKSEITFGDLKKGDKILGYVGEPFNQVRYMFVVTKLISNVELELKKMVEVADGVSISEEMQQKFVPDILLKIDEEQFNFIYSKFLKCIDSPFESKMSVDDDIDENERIPGGENIILYGVPGSGKSWTIEKYCKEEEFNNQDCIERVVFHPDYMYSDFVGQILPCVNKESEGVEYKFIPGPFTKIMKKAYENPTQKYFLVIEEINRGNASAIFGDIFQLLDRKIKNEEDENGNVLYRKGTSSFAITNEDIAAVMYGQSNSERKIRIPSNLTILATMNSSDQNVFTLDTAFQRRWIMRMIPNVFDKDHPFKNTTILDTNVSWQDFCETINNQIIKRNNAISSEDKRLGTYFVTKEDLNSATDNNYKDKGNIVDCNRKFAEKVLKYLWDDAFKYSHTEVFNTSKFNTLENIIENFVSKEKNERFDVFSEEVKKELLEGTKSSLDSNSEG